MHTIRAKPFRISALLLSVTFVLLLAGCAAGPPPTSARSTTTPPSSQQPVVTPRTIVVVGNGNTRVEANIARLTFGIEVVDESVLVANRTASEMVEKVLAALTALEIAGEDVKPYAYNVYAERYYPDYDIHDPGTVPLMPPANEQTRYRVIHQIHAMIRDLDSIATVVAAVVEAGGNSVTIYGIDYLYDDPASLEPVAKARAVADAKRKAEAIAQQIGVELGPPISISEFVQGSHTSWDGLVPTIWPGDIQFYMQIQITYAIKNDISAATPSATPTVTSTVPTTSTSVGGTTATADVSVLSTNAQPGSVTIHGGSEETLRTFLQQYFMQHYPTLETITTDVYVGQLPADMAFAFDVPDDMTVVGSVVTTGPYATTKILLTFAGDATERITALLQQLERQGYTRPAGDPYGGVFLSQAPESTPLCHPDGKLVIAMAGRNLPDGRAIVQLNANTVASFQNPCTSSGDPTTSRFDAIVPALTPPANIAVTSSGGGGDDSSFEATVRFTGDTTIAALAAHYEAQLEAQGWQRLGSSQTEDLAWSGWSRSHAGQDFLVTFYVVRNAGGDDVFTATLRIESAR